MRTSQRVNGTVMQGSASKNYVGNNIIQYTQCCMHVPSAGAIMKSNEN